MSKYISAMLIVILTAIAFAGCASETTPVFATHTVKRGEFVSSVTETGELEAVQSRLIVAPLISWRFGALKITQIVEDGTEVQEGSVLLQFDKNEIQKNVDEARAELDIARAELRKAQVKHQSEIEEKEADLEIARLNHRISELKLEQATFEAEIERKRIELDLEKAAIALEKAGQEIENKKSINIQEVSKLQLKVQQAQAKMDEAEEALEKLTVTAPSPGIAIIQKSWQTGLKYQVDDQPYPGWPMIGLPDLSSMKADVMINEVDISKINVGQEVLIRLDAYPDSLYHGRVSEVASLGRNKDRDSKVKVFDTTILLEGHDQQLMPGMTVSAEVIVERIPDVLFVPLEALFTREGASIVYVRKGGEYEARSVTPGRENDDYVIITEGIEEGEDVALFDPTLSPGDTPGDKSKPGQQGSPPTAAGQ